MNQLTDAEMQEAAAASEKMIAQLKKDVNQLKSPDMDTEKILGRVGVISAMGGMTRTTVLGSALYAGVYGPVVGLTEDQVIEAVRAGWKASQENPLTAKIAEQYAASNATFLAEQQAKKGGSVDAFMVQGDLSKVN